MYCYARTAAPASTALINPSSRPNAASIADAPKAPSKVARRRAKAQERLKSACAQRSSLRLPEPPHQGNMSEAQRSICVTQAKTLNAYKGYLEGLDAIVANAPDHRKHLLEAEFLSREQEAFNAFLGSSLTELAAHSRGLGGRVLASFGDAFCSQLRGADGADAHAPFGSNVGDGLFGKLMALYPSNVSATAQTAERRRLIVDELQEVFSAPGKTRLLSVGCGRGDELSDIFVSSEAFERLEMVMVDAYLPTIQRARDKMAELSDMAGRSANVRFVRKSIASFSRPDALARMGTFDGVYSMGIFEYLPQDDARQLAAGMASLLKPGGSLIIGHHRAEESTTVAEGTWTDWNLVHRDEYDLLRLAGPGLQAKVKVIPHASSEQAFLKATKQA